jgi:hypothetical protein
MASNFLEQLVAEWYEYQDYFVRRNVRVGRRPQGGHEGEMDVVAFNPALGKLVHIETTMGADSWEERKSRFQSKFDTGERYIHTIFKGIALPEHHEKIVVLGFGGTAKHTHVGGGRIIHLKDLVADILKDLKAKPLASAAVPEGFPILRTLQVVAEHRKIIIPILS